MHPGERLKLVLSFLPYSSLVNRSPFGRLVHSGSQIGPSAGSSSFLSIPENPSQSKRFLNKSLTMPSASPSLIVVFGGLQDSTFSSLFREFRECRSNPTLSPLPASETTKTKIWCSPSAPWTVSLVAYTHTLLKILGNPSWSLSMVLMVPRRQ